MTTLLIIGAVLLGGLVVWSFVVGMAENDERRRRMYLGLCIYCGGARHEGECPTARKGR